MTIIAEPEPTTTNTIERLAADLAATAVKLRDALLADGVTVDEMASTVAHIGDAGQYLAGALRIIADAAQTRHKDTGVDAWDEAADEAWTSAESLIKGGLLVEESVVGAFVDARLADLARAEQAKAVQL
jgi:hypothetical protein